MVHAHASTLPGTCRSACSRVFLLVFSRRDRFQECDGWCGECCSGKRARLIADVWVKHMRRSILMLRVIGHLLTTSVEHPVTLPNQRPMSVCESEMSESNEVCAVAVWKAHQGLSNGMPEHLCSITFRLQIGLTNLNDRT